MNEQKLKSMESDGETAQRALEDQIESAKFYRRTTFTAGIASGLTTLWALGTTVWGMYGQIQEPSCAS